MRPPQISVKAEIMSKAFKNLTLNGAIWWAIFAKNHENIEKKPLPVCLSLWIRFIMGWRWGRGMKVWGVGRRVVSHTFVNLTFSWIYLSPFARGKNQPISIIMSIQSPILTSPLLFPSSPSFPPLSPSPFLNKSSGRSQAAALLAKPLVFLQPILQNCFVL